MKRSKLSFQMMKTQFIGLGILGGVVVVAQLFFYWSKKQEREAPILVEFAHEELAPLQLESFNPNQLTFNEWKKLGFSDKQVQIILNYKELIGGRFSSKEQLARCYAISEQKFQELEAYILLPNKQDENRLTKYFSSKKKLNIKEKFDPNNFSVKDWQELGFTEKQAEAILKYKRYLGGNFKSKEQFKECFVISDENYALLFPYLILPDKITEKREKNVEINQISYTFFDPNDLDILGWQQLGFTEKQAKAILNYRDKILKGSFRTLEDIEKCFVISEQKFLEIKPWVKIKFKELELTKKENLPASKTDFSKIDLNKITYKELIEFGFDQKSAKSFLGYRNKLGGFMNKLQILETYHIDPNIANRLLSISFLDVSKIQKYTLKEAPEDFLKNHPYFRKYASKIMYYRISFSSDKDIFKKIQASPEEVAKMRLYLE